MVSKYKVGDRFINKFGEYEIIEMLQKGKAIVRFIETGFTVEIFISNIKTVADKSIPNPNRKYKEGMILESKRGRAEILKVYTVSRARKNLDGTNTTRTQVAIKFEQTGYITDCTPDDFARGKIRDYLQPNVQGVGILGYVENIEGRLRDMPEYRLWEGVIGRCYGANCSQKNKSYETATIEERWKRFDFFLEDLPNIPNYEWWKRFKKEYPNTKNIFEFDKDTIMAGNKTYSRETCSFIPKYINAGFTAWAFQETKQQQLKELEELTYESIIEEARKRKLI